MESLSDVYPAIVHVQSLNLGGAPDSAVWDYAKMHGFAIVSKDSDFAERSFLENDPPKIIWTRLGNCSTADVERLLRFAADTILGFVEEGIETCLIIGRG